MFPRLTDLRALRGFPFLLGAIILESAVFAAVLGMNLAGWNQYLTWLLAAQPLPLLLIICEWVHIAVRRRAGRLLEDPKEAFLPAEQLVEHIVSLLPSMEGTFDVFNAEMNTLRNEQFWDRICDTPSIHKIRIVLPRRIFERLERSLTAAHPLVRHAHKVRIQPVRIEPDREHFAFALLRSAKGPAGDRAVLFFKLWPYSIRERVGDEYIYRYTEFLASARPTRTKTCRDLFDAMWQDEFGTFTPEDLVHFETGAPHTEDVLVANTGLTQVALDQLLLPTRVANKPLEVARDATSADAWEFVLRDSDARMIVRASFPTESHRPLKSPVLWLPPWASTQWAASVSPIDAFLLERGHPIIHLDRYPGSSESFTVTAAIAFCDALVRQMSSGQLDPRLRELPITAIGVSLGAFVAAELAASNAHIHRLAMLAPVLDFFDVIDRFREYSDDPEMVTRRIYFGKGIFRLGTLDDTYRRLFRWDARNGFLVDLMARGSKRCRGRHVTQNVGKVLARNGMVYLAAAREDDMVDWDDLVALEGTAGGHNALIRLSTIAWWHEIDGDGGASPGLVLPGASDIFRSAQDLLCFINPAYRGELRIVIRDTRPMDAPDLIASRGGGT